MSVKIHPVQTGIVKIKTAQQARQPGGLLRVLTSGEWTEWLPIYAWVIEHPEGLIVVDSGETARTSQPGYFPWWHPYYRTSVRTRVKPEEEIGPLLRQLGISPRDIKTLILTHFHTDHAGGLHHFDGVRILVPGGDYRLARSTTGRLLGYLPGRWPEWFNPAGIPFDGEGFGPFTESYSLTRAGDVIAVQTPGHTPGHLSVIVAADDLIYFLAGDTSYTQQLLLDRMPDGVSPDPAASIRTMDKILELAGSRPLVYLPTHDPHSHDRLIRQQVVAQIPADRRVDEEVVYA